jgi:hypothetical protein
MKKLILILPVVILFITSCNKEIDNIPDDNNIKVTFNNDSITDIDEMFTTLLQ